MDDRFYTAIMLAHRLYELRRGKTVNKKQKKQADFSFMQIRAPKLI